MYGYSNLLLYFRVNMLFNSILIKIGYERVELVAFKSNDIKRVAIQYLSSQCASIELHKLCTCMPTKNRNYTFINKNLLIEIQNKNILSNLNIR